MLHLKNAAVRLGLLFFLSASVLNAETSLKHEKYQLTNGLEVILQQDTSVPDVAISVWYHVGAVNEKSDKTGFAHLFEHLMFEGSAHIKAGEHFKFLEQIGASSINGTTSFERTNYIEKVPAAELPLALWLESDRMGFFLAAFTQEKLDEQREVVKNERRQTYENAPYGLAREKAWQHLFPQSHPFYGQIIGSMDHLNAASLEDVKDFFQRYYSPSNATLALVGNFDVAIAKKLIAHYFGQLASRAKPQAVILAPLTLSKNIEVRVKEPFGKLALVELSYPSARLFTQDDADLDILATVLTGDKNALLTKMLMHDENLVAQVSAGQFSQGTQSIFTISAVVNNKVATETVIEKIESVIKHIQKHGVPQNLITKAYNGLKLQKLLSLEKIGGLDGRAELMQNYNHYTGNPDFSTEDFQRYQLVSSRSLQKVAQTYLTHHVTLIAQP